ncbi:MAG: hypothetical protein ACYTG6_15185, partial [Planctomycetota bacterium]
MFFPCLIRWLPLVLLVVFFAAPRDVAADVVHLRTGEAVKGRPVQELSNDDFLAMEDYLSGAMRRFSWKAVDPADRDRIQEAWGWTNKGQGVVTGHRVVQNLAGGDQEEILGLKLREDAQFVILLSNGQEHRIPRGQIDSIEEVEMDARDIWEPDDLVQRFLEEEKFDLADLDSRQHWRIGQYAEWAGAYEVAREHYAAAAADENYLKREVASQRLARVEGLLRDQAALAMLRDARLKLHMKLFGRVRTMLEEFEAQHPDASEAVSQALERLRSDFEQKRTQEFQRIAGRYFVKDVERFIQQKVRETDIAITDVTAWTRSDLPDAAFERLAERMSRYDEVTPEEARTFWEGRPKRSWRRVSYGSGTFIVEPPKIQPPKPPSGGGRQPRGGGGAAPRIRIPKPPNRDQWWAKSSPDERTSWTLAYFI